MKNKIICILCVVSVLILVSACSKTEDTTFTVQTTTGGDNYYNNLTLQMGVAGSTTPVAQATVNSSGVATFNIDASQFSGKEIWFCVPKMVKFCHTMTADESSAGKLVLPDKDKGCTVDATGLRNVWTVGLYMGVNKDGGTGDPIYWGTGNVIAVKTNAANSGDTELAYHMATQDENLAEGINDGTYVGSDTLLESETVDGYQAMPAGTRWDLFSFGDVTGKTLYYDQLTEYVTVTKQKVDDDIIYEISGDKEFDIATQIGEGWRTPTGGNSEDTELAAFEDTSFPDIDPDSLMWYEGSTFHGLKYEYAYTVDGKTVTTNTLYIPAAGYKHGTSLAAGRGKMCFYWSSVADPTMTPSWSPVETSTDDLKVWTQAFNFGYLPATTVMLEYFAHPRTSGQCIRPVID